MSKAGETKIAASTDDYTKVTFKPDLPKFGMECLSRDMVALLTRRVYDLAGCLSGVKVYLNGKRIPVSGALSCLALVGCGSARCMYVVRHCFLCKREELLNTPKYTVQYDLRM